MTHIYFERNSLIRHCLFENNYKQNANGFTVQLRGSRENEGSNILEDCLFRNNRSESLSIYNTGTAGTNPGKHTVRRTKFINNKDKVVLINEQALRPIDIYECLFEGNEAVSTAATSPDGNVITGGSSGALTIARSIIRNNRNTSAADANWKNSIISLNSSTAKLVNCLVVNNSSLHLTIYANGSIYNSTIVNNDGSLFGAGWASLFNNAFIDNKPTNGVIPFKMDTESACYFVNNAFNSRSNIGTGGPNAEVVGTIETDITAFVNPTTFQGVAQTDAQKLELSNANFSLAQTATIKNAGTIVELKDFMGTAYDTDLFQKDLAGNARLGSNNELNIGAYQGDALSGIYDLIDDTLLSVTVVKNGLILNVDSEVIASIYSTSGALLFTKRLNQGENFIPVNTKGVSILQVGSKSTKIVM